MDQELTDRPDVTADPGGDAEFYDQTEDVMTGALLGSLGEIYAQVGWLSDHHLNRLGEAARRVVEAVERERSGRRPKPTRSNTFNHREIMR